MRASTLGGQLRPLFHPKAVLLVHDDEAQTVKADRLLQEGVGSDGHLHLTRSNRLPKPLPLPYACPSAQEADLNPHGLQDGLGLQVVLLRQDLCRRHNRPLEAASHGMDHGQEGHRRLPRPHIPLQEAHHGSRPRHVSLDLLQDPLLGGGKLKPQACPYRRFDARRPRHGTRHIRLCRPTHAGHAEAQQQEVIEGEAPLPRLRVLHLLGKMDCPESLGKGHEAVTMEDPVRKEVLNLRGPR